MVILLDYESTRTHRRTSSPIHHPLALLDVMREEEKPGAGAPYPNDLELSRRERRDWQHSYSNVRHPCHTVVNPCRPLHSLNHVSGASTRIRARSFASPVV